MGRAAGGTPPKTDGGKTLAARTHAWMLVGWLVDAIFIPSEDSRGFSLIPQAPHHPACDKSGAAAESAIKKSWPEDGERDDALACEVASRVH